MFTAPLKLLIAALILLLALLQYELWFSSNGIRQYLALRHAITLQKQENSTLEQRNDVLVSEINNLKQGNEAIEEHARNDLGMVKKGEMFYQVVPSR